MVAKQVSGRLVRHELRFQNAAIAQAYKAAFEKSNLSPDVKRNVLSFQCGEHALPAGFFEKIATYRGYLGKMSIFVD